MEKEQHTIDATGKRLGRLATEVSTLLLGKHRPDVTRNVFTPIAVTVEHASNMLLDDRKKQQKEYDRYSGYPGGRSTLTMQKMIDQKGYAEVVRKAVYGMLPSNRLRALRMKSLTVRE